MRFAFLVMFVVLSSSLSCAKKEKSKSTVTKLKIPLVNIYCETAANCANNMADTQLVQVLWMNEGADCLTAVNADKISSTQIPVACAGGICEVKMGNWINP